MTNNILDILQTLQREDCYFCVMPLRATQFIAHKCKDLICVLGVNQDKRAGICAAFSNVFPKKEIVLKIYIQNKF